MISAHSHETRSGHTVYYTGPHLKDGPLPAFFYFSLGGEESLTLDPFNQPVVHLQDAPLRVFSLDLPYHGPGFDKHAAIGYWSKAMAEGHHPLSEFLDTAHAAIADLVEEGLVTKIAAGGLSRGGFVATHLAAREPRIESVVGFAPMTDLSYLRDFQKIKERPEIRDMALIHQADKLTRTHIRYYIGNHDTAVGTPTCFDFVNTVAEAAHNQRVRSPTAWLFISPSIGHRGHGTPPHIFADGAQWIRERLA